MNLSIIIFSSFKSYERSQPIRKLGFQRTTKNAENIWAGSDPGFQNLCFQMNFDERRFVLSNQPTSRLQCTIGFVLLFTLFLDYSIIFF